MERKINRKVLELGNMETEDLYSLRHAFEQEITDAIHGMNLCNIELNGRGEQMTLPEFGRPMVSIEGVIPDDAA